MSLIQPAFDGARLDAPAPSEDRSHIDDYEAWESQVRPTFIKVAKSGRRHWVAWQIKKEFKLPDPPDVAHDWGAFIGQLSRDGVIRHDGYGHTADRSVVNAWTGTRAAVEGRVS